ncbi:hypothetical protein EYF80_051791 [Liparis tanakae]|uniref:Uncharacterized protein n=1 Tax=Liparis tanakae TaxID=230148 RepID=A0A4Z2FAU4_9TELE|nr:hypothetical protein EYF80_051791 [Liparis tanakae]
MAVQVLSSSRLVRNESGPTVGLASSRRLVGGELRPPRPRPPGGFISKLSMQQLSEILRCCDRLVRPA